MVGSKVYVCQIWTHLAQNWLHCSKNQLDIQFWITLYISRYACLLRYSAKEVTFVLGAKKWQNTVSEEKEPLVCYGHVVA